MLRIISIILFLFYFTFTYANHPFSYDLHLTRIKGKSPQVAVTAHGMGGNYQIAHWVEMEKTLVTFNFPDYDMHYRRIKAKDTKFGTIDEVLPFIYVIKLLTVDEGQSEVDLYGMSAGGGAIINVLAVLNTTRFDKQLKKIGVAEKEKEVMLKAIQNGAIILDTPLKSIREVNDYRGWDKDSETFAKRYRENDMEPIDSLKYLKGLSLHIILHFQKPDEVLSNRDDDLYYNKLKSVNSLGSTKLIVGRDHGHSLPHKTLWDFYRSETDSIRR